MTNSPDKRQARSKNNKSIRASILRDLKLRAALNRDAFYSLAECGALVGMAMTTIWKHVATGALKSSRIGRRIVVRGSDLDDFIRAREQDPRSPLYRAA